MGLRIHNIVRGTKDPSFEAQTPYPEQYGIDIKYTIACQVLNQVIFVCNAIVRHINHPCKSRREPQN